MELTDEKIKVLEDYYFERYARHNEDFAGCENWIEGLEDDEIEKILEMQEFNEEKLLKKIKEGMTNQEVE